MKFEEETKAETFPENEVSNDESMLVPNEI